MGRGMPWHTTIASHHRRLHFHHYQKAITEKRTQDIHIPFCQFIGNDII